MSAILKLLLGSSPWTTIIGLLGGALVEVAAWLSSAHPSGAWHVVAVVLLALGRAAKDANRTGGTSPPADYTTP